MQRTIRFFDEYKGETLNVCHKFDEAQIEREIDRLDEMHGVEVLWEDITDHTERYSTGILESTFYHAIQREMNHLLGTYVLDRVKFIREDEGTTWMNLLIDKKQYDVSINMELKGNPDDAHFIDMTIEGEDVERVIQLDDIVRDYYTRPTETELVALTGAIRENLAGLIKELKGEE